jgi:hypothetical protein
MAPPQEETKPLSIHSLLVSTVINDWFSHLLKVNIKSDELIYTGIYEEILYNSLFNK